MRRFSRLMVCLYDLLQGDVFVAVAGLRVLFRDGQLDGPVGAGMDAGQAGLTAARRAITCGMLTGSGSSCRAMYRLLPVPVK